MRISVGLLVGYGRLSSLTIAPGHAGPVSDRPAFSCGADRDAHCCLAAALYQGAVVMLRDIADSLRPVLTSPCLPTAADRG